VGLQSIGLWQLLVVIAVFLNPVDFVGTVANWYLASKVLGWLLKQSSKL